MLSLAIAATMALAVSSAAAATYSQPAAEKYIRDSEAAWVKAEMTGDASVAKRILAEDYVGVFPDGSVAGKAEAVADFKPSNTSLSGRLDYVHVRFFGDTAIAQGQETDAWPSGSPYPSGRLIFTDVFVLRAGQWVLVNSEDQYQPTPK
jgi:ketosteroid isomerase-like protein